MRPSSLLQIEEQKGDGLVMQNLEVIKTKDVFTNTDIVDPVFGGDGHCYSRDNLKEYLNSRSRYSLPCISPITKEIMSDVMSDCPAIEPLSSTLSLASSSTSSFSSSDLESSESIQSLANLTVIFKKLDSFRGIFANALQQNWAPPCVIFLGVENSGKSTVLERLTMMSLFPRAEGRCTCMAIHAHLRHGPVVKPVMLEIVEMETKIVKLRVMIPIDNGNEDVKDMMNMCLAWEAGDKRTPSSDGVHADVGVVTKHIMVLHIESPHVPTIDMIDLPGIVSFPPALKQATMELASSTIEIYKDRSIFLFVAPSSTVFNSDQAYCLIHSRGLQVKFFWVFKFILPD